MLMNDSSKNKARQGRAGSAHLATFKDDPASQAGIQRARERLADFVKRLPAIRDGAERDFELIGLPRPDTLEDIEHVARIVELHPPWVRAGDYTLRDVYAQGLAWSYDKDATCKRIARLLPLVPREDSDPPLCEPLTKSELVTLNALAVFRPERLVSISEVADTLDDTEDHLSARTIGGALGKLIKNGLAERPQGARHGARLTTAGRRLAAKQDCR